jgi:hypothetical protein
VEYEVQVDTVNTFDSNSGVIDSFIFDGNGGVSDPGDVWFDENLALGHWFHQFLCQ